MRARASGPKSSPALPICARSLRFSLNWFTRCLPAGRCG
jgi:hypothetical protein